MKPQYDVIIVGAGMVGATLALALSQNTHLHIALIEAHPPAPLKSHDEPDLRVSAITRASEMMLRNLGIWQHLMVERISPFSDMEVWEERDSLLHFDCAEIGEPVLGHIIENRHLQQACLQCCQQQTNIDMLWPAKPAAMQGNRLQLDDGRELSARLIVSAEGAHSPLRSWAGIDTRGWAYDQSAVVCTVSTEKPHQHTAWQKFLPEGPLAFLPLADPHQCSIVWSQQTDTALELAQLEQSVFLERLGQAFDQRLGKISAVSERASFPLKLRHAETYIKPGFALVGDAAHTIHPLAGQGVNIGLLDAIALAEVVTDAAVAGRDIGSLHTLAKYQRRRKADNIAMQMSMDAFKRLFGCQFAPLRWARRFGLRQVNQSVVLKKLFMQQAAGYRFATPVLAFKPYSSSN